MPQESAPLHCHPEGRTDGKPGTSPPSQLGDTRTQLLLVSGGQPGIKSHETVSVAMSDTVTKTFLRYSKDVPLLLHSSFPVVFLSGSDLHYHFWKKKKKKEQNEKAA